MRGSGAVHEARLKFSGQERSKVSLRRYRTHLAAVAYRYWWRIYHDRLDGRGLERGHGRKVQQPPFPQHARVYTETAHVDDPMAYRVDTANHVQSQSLELTRFKGRFRQDSCLS